MHPKPKNRRRSDINPFKPDLKLFPLFAKAKPIKFTLHLGESLFAAPEWWHSTRMLTPSITMASGHITLSNWHLFMKDEYNKREGWCSQKPLNLYLYLVGKLLNTYENITKPQFKVSKLKSTGSV